MMVASWYLPNLSNPVIPTYPCVPVRLATRARKVSPYSYRSEPYKAHAKWLIGHVSLTYRSPSDPLSVRLLHRVHGETRARKAEGVQKFRLNLFTPPYQPPYQQEVDMSLLPFRGWFLSAQYVPMRSR
ncbi:hypothetical protein C8Q80DRAFT_191520 [Daedaleopsis nitida]|nr:hypothetical protein C8Q80DRAFT_191520 [Daedaleopsis nitida]